MILALGSIMTLMALPRSIRTLPWPIRIVSTTAAVPSDALNSRRLSAAKAVVKRTTATAAATRRRVGRSGLAITGQYRPSGAILVIDLPNAESHVAARRHRARFRIERQQVLARRQSGERQDKAVLRPVGGVEPPDPHGVGLREDDSIAAIANRDRHHDRLQRELRRSDRSPGSSSRAPMRGRSAS